VFFTAAFAATPAELSASRTRVAICLSSSVTPENQALLPLHLPQIPLKTAKSRHFLLKTNKNLWKIGIFS
jgi:hypothetical protein